MIDGLGSKAIDSNELRKQKHSESAVPILDLQMRSIPNRSSTSNSTLKPFDLCPGALPPMNPSQTSHPSDFKLGLTLENTVHAPSSDDFGVSSPKSSKSSSPSRKLQQVFEEALVKEAEVRAANLMPHTTQSDCSQGKVQVSNPNPRFLFNARGHPYVEGDPNLGYSSEDNKPWNAHPHLAPADGPNPNPQFPLNQHTKSTSKIPSHQPHNTKPFAGSK
ncbi:hypothetical protein RHMOL_Rhmol02G0152100 [Rhododendron molle]|uniref:Uncharacterized protein n=1 Tax=Rhododendron molle TaxID=49168 RepID=A0ACC0PQ55_RHOML|nr:hypothetical protein RHMOL_Rhmol02G0152100 [Rhododendron molle]